MDELKVKIPIRNIFYMLCYAWNVLDIKDNINVGIDDCNDAYNLLARVFSFGISRLIRTGFHRSYIQKEEELSSVRGKINIQESINKLSFNSKKLVCTYDEYSTNDLFNQIIAYTIDSLLINKNIDKDIKKELRNYLSFFNNIDRVQPNKENRRKLIFNRNNVTYRLLINIAVMIFDNTSPDENGNDQIFDDFYREKQMHKVFELFILNFYSMHLDKKIYKVHAPKINWQLDENRYEIYKGLFDVNDQLDERRTDIVIENKDLKYQIIIDAKYYKKTFVDAYMNSDDEKIRGNHLSQVKGYIDDSKFEGKKIGALIYPMVNNDLANGQVKAIQGANIIYKTINLNTEWVNIEKDLINFLEKLETAIDRF